MFSSETTKPTILVIDDEEPILRLLQKALNRLPFRTLLASDAAEAIGLINQEASICTVVSDIRMAGTDGMALLTHLHRERPDLPVVLMTGFGERDQYQTAMENGAFAYLLKPFEISDLIRTVSSAVAAHTQKHPPCSASCPARPS